jgi:hypothetical protein
MKYVALAERQLFSILFIVASDLSKFRPDGVRPSRASKIQIAGNRSLKPGR